MERTALLFLLKINVLLIFFPGCNFYTDSKIWREDAKCLMEGYIEQRKLTSSDTILVKEFYGWTDSTSLVSIKEFRNGRSLISDKTLFVNKFQEITFLYSIESIENNYLDETRNPSFVPDYTKKKIFKFVKKPHDFAPENFFDVQVEFSRELGVIEFLLGSDVSRELRIRCDSLY